MRAVAYESWAPTLDRVFAAGREHPGATFVNVDLTPLQNAGFSWRTRPALHVDQIAALGGRGAGLSAPLPSKRYYGYFPLQYAAPHDFLRAMPDWTAAPQAQPLSAYRAAHRGAPQVLIVTAPDDGDLKLANTLGYGDCTTNRTGVRRLAFCTPSIR